MTTSPLVAVDWLHILDPEAAARLGDIRHALFDFDGTISLLRQGWEEVMVPLMIEMICGDHAPAPEIAQEVRDYVDFSTGIVTIEQMQWLAGAVRRHGLASHPQTAAAYKALYLERLNVRVAERLRRLRGGEIDPDQMAVAGARAFLAGLAGRGVRLYLASGTDHAFVLEEAGALGVADFFTGGIYGALDGDDAHRKERIIQRILDENRLRGSELLVVGDGPVEMREAIARHALALGIASDEVAHRGWDPGKAARLTRAGAQFLAPDFVHGDDLLDFLFP